MLHRLIPLTVAIGILLAAAGAPAAAESSVISVALVGYGQFAAIRLNFSAPPTTEINILAAYCPPQDVVQPRGVFGATGFVIADGITSLRWFPTGYRLSEGEAGAFGQSVYMPFPFPSRGGCPSANRDWVYTGGHPHAASPLKVDSSLTYVVAFAEEYAWLNMTYDASLVESFDITTGPAVILRQSEFSQGAHASAYPLVMGGGGVVRHTMETERDVVGWFGTNFWESPVDVNSCKKDGVDCPPPMGRYWPRLLAADAPALWEFVIAEAGFQGPSLALGVVEFPDDSYVG